MTFSYWKNSFIRTAKKNELSVCGSEPITWSSYRDNDKTSPHINGIRSDDFNDTKETSYDLPSVNAESSIPFDIYAYNMH